MAAALRTHWLFALVLGAGLVLRVLAQLSYRPALFYIDTIRYLYASGGNDPVAYRLPLKVILAVGNIDAVAVIQHLLGLAIAVAIYLILIRGGTPRWLAALAATPVLLDAYQIQMEQMLLPDIWFEALIVAAIVILLSSAGTTASLGTAMTAGLIFGLSATFRQVGEVFLLPALLYLIVAGGGWRVVLSRSAVLTAGFLVPVIAYMTGAYLAAGHFSLSHTGVTSTYGRMAYSADCATLRLPSAQRALCPTPAQHALGPDGLEHSTLSPLRSYYLKLPHAQASHLVASFNNAVLAQQPGRVLGTYLTDTVKLFAPARMTSPGDTPISRWQFQVRYPYLFPHATRHVVQPIIARYGGGQPRVWRPAATFLRRYQLGGGYTPGPLLAFCLLAGLAGAALAIGRRRRDGSPDATRAPAMTCLLFVTCGVALLAVSDIFEFSWRYQLPALVTLPPACAAAIAAFGLRGKARRSR
jgi:hypothetical protein